MITLDRPDGTQDAIEGVLFDLDGTLLDIDIDDLISRYMKRLAPIVAESMALSPEEAVALVFGGTKQMSVPHPGMTNQQVFNDFILEKTGRDLADPKVSAPIDAFYEEIFPTFQGSARPFASTREALETCLSLGLRVGVATQPVFPTAATRARMVWAAIDDLDLEVVSTYENSYATKPQEEYFLDMASKIGVDPNRVIMVGDEPVLDMSAIDVGMKTFYVGYKNQQILSTWRGDLDSFVDVIKQGS